MEQKPTQESTLKAKKGFNREPRHSIRFRTSKDKKYVMVDILQTWIFPKNYIGTISKNAFLPVKGNEEGSQEKEA